MVRIRRFESSIDIRLELLGQHLNVRLLKHARVTAGNIKGSNAPRRSLTPSEQRIEIPVDIRFVVSGTVHRSKQKQFAVQRRRRLILALRKSIRTSDRNALQKCRQTDTKLQVSAEKRQ